MPRTLDWRARKLVARIQKNHADRDAVEALAAHYAKHNDQASLANLMAGYADTIDDSSAAADAYVRAADAALMLDDRIRAESLYERALQRDPAHGGALDRALRVADASGDVAGMQRILTGVIAAARARALTGRLIASLQFRLGQIYDSRLREPERAAELYRQALDSFPLINAMVAARRLYRQAGDHMTVSRLYEAEIEVTRAAEDKRALLLRLAEHEQTKREDLSAAVDALRRACKLDPSDISSLRKLADLLIARSERASGAARETDVKRAAEVFYQIARVVPRADAPPLLLRSLALVPQHARANALLHELRGHAAQGGESRFYNLADQPQLYLDQRATLQVASPLEAVRASGVAATRTSAAPPLAAAEPPDATQALSTGDLRALRVDPTSEQSPIAALEPAPAAPLPAAPPPGVPAGPAVARETPALSSEEVQAQRVDEPAEPKRADRTQALSTQELSALRLDETPPPQPPPIPPPRSIAPPAPPPVAAAAPAAAEHDYWVEAPTEAAATVIAPSPAQPTAPLQPESNREPTEVGIGAPPSPIAPPPTPPAQSADAIRSATPIEAEPPPPSAAPHSPAQRADASREPTQVGIGIAEMIAAEARAEPAALGRERRAARIPTSEMSFEAPELAIGSGATHVRDTLGASEPAPDEVPEPKLPAARARKSLVYDGLSVNPIERDPAPAVESAVADAQRAAPAGFATRPSDALSEPPHPGTAADAAPEERLSRARVVERLELDPIREELEVNLGATTDSNLYVDMDGRLADGGVFVATYQALSAGTSVTLNITLPGALTTRAHGRVTLKRDSLEAFDDPAPGFCVAFETLSAEALSLLERFASKRTPWLIEDE